MNYETSWKLFNKSISHLPLFIYFFLISKPKKKRCIINAYQKKCQKCTRGPKGNIKTKKTKCKETLTTPDQLTKSTIDILASFKPTLTHSKNKHKKENLMLDLFVPCPWSICYFSHSKQPKKHLRGQPSIPPYFISFLPHKGSLPT